MPAQSSAALLLLLARPGPALRLLPPRPHLHQIQPAEPFRDTARYPHQHTFDTLELERSALPAPVLLPLS